jgi:voltage-gated potassium channel
MSKQNKTPLQAVSPKPLEGWQRHWYTVIFEADTPAGRLFDVTLIGLILLSVAVVMADSVQALRQSYGHYFNALEWFFTIAFTLEYIARLMSVRKPLK